MDRADFGVAVCRCAVAVVIAAEGGLAGAVVWALFGWGVAVGFAIAMAAVVVCAAALCRVA